MRTENMKDFNKVIKKMDDKFEKSKDKVDKNFKDMASKKINLKGGN